MMLAPASIQESWSISHNGVETSVLKMGIVDTRLGGQQVGAVAVVHVLHHEGHDALSGSL